MSRLFLISILLFVSVVFPLFAFAADPVVVPGVPGSPFVYIDNDNPKHFGSTPEEVCPTINPGSTLCYTGTHYGDYVYQVIKKPCNMVSVVDYPICAFSCPPSDYPYHTVQTDEKGQLPVPGGAYCKKPDCSGLAGVSDYSTYISMGFNGTDTFGCVNSCQVKVQGLSTTVNGSGPWATYVYTGEACYKVSDPNAKPGDSGTGDSGTGDSGTGYSGTGDSGTGDSGGSSGGSSGGDSGGSSGGDSGGSSGGSSGGDSGTGSSGGDSGTGSSGGDSGGSSGGDSGTGSSGGDSGGSSGGDSGGSSGGDSGGDSGTGDSGTGDSGTGDSGTGDSGTGDSGIGDSGTGDSGIGDSGTGDSGTGDSGTGDSGTGDSGTGDSGTCTGGGSCGGTGPNAGGSSGGDSGGSSGGDSGGSSGGDSGGSSGGDSGGSSGGDSGSGSGTGGSGSGGSGTGDGTCTGDDCGDGEGSDFCKKNPDVLACVKLGDPTSDKVIENEVVNVKFNAVSWGADNSACPAPLHIRGDVYFSYQPACDFFAGIRPVVIAAAFVIAALIVIGAGKGDD